MKILKQAMLGTSASVGLALATAALSATALTPAAFAQSYTTGAVTGSVSDQMGQPLAGATVTVVSTARGTTRSIVTGADGEFVMGRLPLGEFTITVESPGFQTISDDSLVVRVGTTAEVNFVMESGETTEVITVTGSAIQSNVFAVGETGLTIDVDEIFEQVPVGRDITSLTLLAPGTTRADSAFGGTSIAGSSAGENVFYINGLNVTNFRNFVGASTIPFEFYETVEVKTGGYQAEFGRSTGGVINAVTRSGSNELEYGFNIFYAPDELRDDVPDTTTSANYLDQSTSTDMDFYVSGPLVNDRVFFYGLYSPRFRETVNVGSQSERMSVYRDDSPFWGVQLDANLFEGHTLAFTAFSDKREGVTTTYDVTFDEDGGIASQFNPREATSYRGGDVYILNYTGALTDWLTMSVTAGSQSFDQTSLSSADELPAVYNYTTGVGFTPVGDWASFSIQEGSDQRELIRVDFDTNFSFFGDHSVRFGVDREDLTASAFTINSGGAYYLYADAPYCENAGGPTGEACVRWRDYSSGGDFNTIQTAFYIQDAWQVTDQLTLNLGLRRETFDNRNAEGETFVEIADQLAPRIAASYDVFGDGELEVYGSWGRYHLPVATNTNIRMAGAETYIHRYYEYDGRSDTYVPNTVGEPWRTSVLGDGTVPDTRSLIGTDLDPMYSDELILGTRWNRWDNWDLGISFTYRELASTLEDVAIDAAVIAYCEANNITTGDGTPCADEWTGFHQYVLTNPGQDLTTFLPELGENGEFVTLAAEDLGYPEVERTYTALDINVAHWGDNYRINGSWTISESQGNYEGSVKSDNGQDDAGITQDFDQPGLVDGSDGLLPNHRAHRIKVWGSYNVTDEFIIGANLQVTSPRKFGCIGYHPTDAFAYEYGASSWYCGGELTERGSVMETDWITNLDMSFVYSPTDLPYPGTPTFRMDVFNVLGADGATDLYETGDSSAPAPGANYDANDVVADPRFGEEIGFQSPRYVRFGVSWDF
ncbi:carboxypeptidase regulatory-like domain-containing protein [Maricaulis sp. D1M11]|uniref:TonB-dependent receptor n=1 Tax=Maricaulis sp. D1M11 TaxID=3076117 RepID=UPI0039B6BB62